VPPRPSRTTCQATRGDQVVSLIGPQWEPSTEEELTAVVLAAKGLRASALRREWHHHGHRARASRCRRGHVRHHRRAAVLGPEAKGRQALSWASAWRFFPVARMERLLLSCSRPRGARMSPQGPSVSSPPWLTDTWLMLALLERVLPASTPGEPSGPLGRRSRACPPWLMMKHRAGRGCARGESPTAHAFFGGPPR